VSADDCAPGPNGKELLKAAEAGVLRWNAPTTPGIYVLKSTVDDSCDAGGMKVLVNVTCR
jgi:hypothetical protein